MRERRKIFDEADGKSKREGKRQAPRSAGTPPKVTLEELGINLDDLDL